jgi:hypothetical protein
MTDEQLLERYTRLLGFDLTWEQRGPDRG